MDASTALAMLYRGANLSVGLSLFAVAGAHAGSREAAARYGVKLMIGPAHHDSRDAAESRFVSVSLVDLLPRNDASHDAVDIRLRYSQLGAAEAAASELSSQPDPQAALEPEKPFHLGAELPIESGSYHFEVVVGGKDRADFIVEV